RVMHVQEIEILFFSDGRHLRRQCKRVRLMLKQRIRHHLDFVKTHPIVELRQPGWQCRGNEVDCVAACCEFFSELRADDAAAAVSRVYRNADVHFAKMFSRKAAKAQRNRCKKFEAGDPRYRLPLSQLDSPSERGGK